MNSFFSNFMYFVLSSLHSFSIFSFTCPFVDECRGGMNDFCAKVYWILHLRLKIFVLYFSPRLFFLIWSNVAEVLLFRCPAFPEVLSKLHCVRNHSNSIELSIAVSCFERFHCSKYHCSSQNIIASNIIAQNIIAPPKISLLKISLLLPKYHC